IDGRPATWESGTSRDGVQLPHGYVVIIGVLEVQGHELFVYAVMDGISSSLSEQVTKGQMEEVD
ncbi:hypothetical protein FOMG_19358, partial [Fusarium oxysporum f. sp. melonis 26406]